MRPTTVLYQPQPWGEAWKILCFCLPGCQDYEVHQINLKLKLIGRKKKGKRSSYNFNLWKLRKTIWRMDLGVKFQNPLQKTSFCRQQDTHHSPVAEQLLVFSRHSYWNATNGSIFGPPFKDTFGGRAGVPMASSTLSLCLLHPERWQWLQRSPPERSPSPQLLLPSLNGLSTEAARSKDLRWCPLFSPLSLPNTSCMLWASYPLILPMQNTLFQKACLAWWRATASCLNPFLLGRRVRHLVCRMGSALPMHDVSAEKWNNIFLLLLFIPGVHICNTDSPMHSCSTLLIKAIFCNILFTLPTFIIIEISLGESSQCSRMVTVNDHGSGWNKQESRTWTWWYTILNSSTGAVTCKPLVLWRRNSHQQMVMEKSSLSGLN